MSRLESAPAKGLFRKYVYRSTRKRVGRDLEPVGITAHHGWLLAGMGAYEIALERSKKVDDRLKMLAETKAALMVGCEFCIDIAAHISAEHGITDEQLLALPRHREATCFSELELLVIDYAAAMTKTPVEVTDELFAALRERFDDAQMVELTAAIAWENWRARFNWAFDIGAAGFREGAACPVPIGEEQAATAAEVV
jgi:4-carboxymuconolactone decarboxylase